MRPVLQTIFGGVSDGTAFADVWTDDPEWVPGNCLQAAVASLLELPLDAVPHFNNDRRPGLGGWLAMREWARGRGQDFREFVVCDDNLDALAMLHADAATGRGDRWCIAIGETDGMAMHAVVWDLAERRCAHDPDPRGNGLAFVRGLLVLRDPYEPDPVTEYEQDLEYRAEAQRHAASP